MERGRDRRSAVRDEKIIISSSKFARNRGGNGARREICARADSQGGESEDVEVVYPVLAIYEWFGFFFLRIFVVRVA